MVDAREARRESGITYIRALVTVMIWLTAGCIGLPIMFYTLPDIEARFYPVLKAQEVDDGHFMPGHDEFFLWRWRFYKNRAAIPEYISFMAFLTDNPNARTPVEVFTDWQCTRNFRADRTSMRGDSNTRNMCARLPPEFRGKQNVAITGWGQYRVGHIFYTVPVDIPTVMLKDRAASP